MVRFAYQAEQQRKQLSQRELAQLIRLLEDDADGEKATVGSPGRFVSRLGPNKRVVWEIGSAGDKVVLAVVSKT
jgi:hypothetical protein